MTVWLGVMLYCIQMNNPNKSKVVTTLNDFECAVNITTSHPFSSKKECEDESDKNHYGKAKCIEIKI